MKTQDFGWSETASDSTEGSLTSIWRQRWFASKESYKANRLNGDDADSPSTPLPLDGECSDWIKCADEESMPQLQPDGSYEQGWRTGSGGFYRIRYQEGPGDKAWMEERDGNYLARLEREGEAAKAEELRASLPTSHPHYRARLTPEPLPAESVSAPDGSSGGGEGSAVPGSGSCEGAAPSPSHS